MSPVPKRPRPGGSALEDALLSDGPQHQPPPAVPAAEPAQPPADKPVGLPAQRQERPPARTRPGAPARVTVAGVTMPTRLDVGTVKPLNVRVPGAMHHAFKVHTTTLGTSMEDVVQALVTVYLQDPELVDGLIVQAADNGQDLGELLHDALLSVAHAVDA